jgi:hypothetical protein
MDGEPTKDAVSKDFLVGYVFRAPSAGLPQLSENPLQRAACSPLGSSVAPIGRLVSLIQLHWLGKRINGQIVMLYLRHFMPFELRRVLNRCLQRRRRSAVRYDVEPITIRAIFCDALLIRRQADQPCGIPTVSCTVAPEPVGRI